MFLKTMSLSAEFNIKCCFCVLGARSLDLTALVAEEYLFVLVISPKLCHAQCHSHPAEECI